MASCVTHEVVNRQSHGPRELAFVGLLEGQRDVVAVAEAVFSQCRDLRARPVPTDNVRAGCELPCFLLRSADLTLNLRNISNRHEPKGASGRLPTGLMLSATAPSTTHTHTRTLTHTHTHTLSLFYLFIYLFIFFYLFFCLFVCLPPIQD
jgi:hypothetical protein